MKKGTVSYIVLVLILLTGLSLLLYPGFADWWNSVHQSQVIVEYSAALDQLSDEDYSQLFEDAKAYNEQLRQIRFPLMYHDQVQGYDRLFNISGNGVMGYIHIEKIDVELPVYHGTSDGVLQVAVGHVQGSSLPTGGESTHSVLSAHRGLPSARLFTDLDKLEVGDLFILTVADRVLTYEVDRILTVLPTDVEYLYVEEGKDLCTLVTCTPYGINSHRLLVRGHRVDNIEQEQAVRVTADAVVVEKLVVAPFVLAPILLVMLIIMLIPKRKS